MKTIALLDDFGSCADWHRALLGTVRRQTGADYIIVAMAGDFSEDSLPARADKYTRAEEAITQGADLALEIPVCAALSDLPTKAFSGVSLLKRLRSVDGLVVLCHGVEGGRLHRLARFLFSAPAGYQAELKKQLQAGFCFLEAQARAVGQFLAAQPDAIADFPASTAEQLLSDPVNQAAVETLKAMYQFYWILPIHFFDISKLGAAQEECCQLGLPLTARQDEALAQELIPLLTQTEPAALKLLLEDTPDGTPELTHRLLLLSKALQPGCSKLDPIGSGSQPEPPLPSESFLGITKLLASMPQAHAPGSSHEILPLEHVRAYLLKLIIGISRGDRIICGLRSNCPHARVLSWRETARAAFVNLLEKSWVSLILEPPHPAWKEGRPALDECGEILAALDQAAHELYLRIS